MKRWIIMVVIVAITFLTVERPYTEHWTVWSNTDQEWVCDETKYYFNGECMFTVDNLN